MLNETFMFNQRYQGLILTLVVLFSVLFGGVYKESPEEVVLEQKTESASLLAAVENNISPKLAVSEVLPPGITATAVLVRDWFASEPALVFNAEQQWPMASLTKLMTAAVALENIGKDAKITMSEKAIATESAAGNFSVGGVYSFTDVLSALLKVSSNDAAVALAEFVGENKFLELMNQKAADLKMQHTRFFDPSGLSSLNQSTLEDLEKLVEYIYYQHPEIFRITQEKEGNIHPFAGRPDFIGGKTGFIDEANGNLISLFNNNGQPLLIIVLGSDDRAKDTQLLYDRFTSR